MNRAFLSPPDSAQLIFRPIAPTYERWSHWLSLGQDRRWRQAMVNELGFTAGSLVLDVAAGTGSITRLMESDAVEVVSIDQSEGMVRMAAHQGAVAVIATAERLPFRDDTFDGVTFGYLLRYVDDVSGCLKELVRVAPARRDDRHGGVRKARGCLECPLVDLHPGGASLSRLSDWVWLEAGRPVSRAQHRFVHKLASP